MPLNAEIAARPRDEHDHGPTAQLLDAVWCATCQHTHIATIPVTTFRCTHCGFGAWGHSIAAAHADSLPEHIVYPLHHATTCVFPPEETTDA